MEEEKAPKIQEEPIIKEITETPPINVPVEEKEKPLNPEDQGRERLIEKKYDTGDARTEVLNAWDKYKLEKNKTDAVTAMQSLNPRHQDFVRAYIATGNATRAYKSVYPDSSQRSAQANGYRLMKADRVQAVLRPISSMQELKVEGLVNRLIELSGPVDTHPDAKGRFIPPIVNVQAISVIGKLAGLEKQEPTGNIIVQWIGLDGKPINAVTGMSKPIKPDVTDNT